MFRPRNFDGILRAAQGSPIAEQGGELTLMINLFKQVRA